MVQAQKVLLFIVLIIVAVLILPPLTKASDEAHAELDTFNNHTKSNKVTPCLQNASHIIQKFLIFLANNYYTSYVCLHLAKLSHAYCTF